MKNEEIHEEIIGMCWCKDCEDYDLVWEIFIKVEAIHTYVQCHETGYDYYDNRNIFGPILRKQIPFNFEKRNSLGPFSYEALNG